MSFHFRFVALIKKFAVQGDVDEQLIKVQKCIEILEYFMEQFEEFREKLPSMFEGKEHGHEPVLWQFHPRMVFQRVMDFVSRLKDINEFFETAHQLNKLEKVVVAGIGGRDLTTKIQKILADFDRIYTHFAGVTYDPLVPEDEGFVEDYKKFVEKVESLDKRLVAIAVQAFDQSYNLMSLFKMLNIWGSILDRPVIKQDMEPKYHRLIDEFNTELDTVKIIYDNGIKDDQFPVDIHYPPVAAKMTWLYKLKWRLREPMETYLEWGEEQPLTKHEDSLYMKRKYDEMMDLIEKEEKRVFEEWAKTVPDICAENLSKPLLIRRPDGTLLLDLNFDPKLTALLREIKYLKVLGVEGIPEEGEQLYSRFEELYSYTSNLSRTVEWYNWARGELSPVELSLVIEEIESLDESIDEIIATLTWNDKDMFDTINAVHVRMKNLYERLKQTQENLKNVLADMDTWASVPLYSRKDNKKDQLLALDDRADRKHKRYKKIQESADKIAYMLDENYRLFFNLDMPDLMGEEEELVMEEEIPSPTPVPSKEKMKKKKKEKGKKKEKKKKSPPKLSPEEQAKLELAAREAEEKELQRRLKWEAYQNYVDDLICEVFVKAAIISVGVFLDETDQTVKHAAPLFQVSLELQEPAILFRPSLNLQDTEGFYVLCQTLLEDIVVMGEMVPRVASIPDSHHYRSTIETNENIIEMMDVTLRRVREAIEKAVEYSAEFEKYNYLWLDNRQAFLKQFLAYGRMLTQEELDMLAIDETAVKETPPSIALFKQQIDLYEDLYKTVELIETEKVIDEWLRIDVRPLRQAILNNVCKWGNLFKQHLVEHVVDSIKDLEEFCKECDAVLLEPLAEDDYEGLLKVMEYLMKVKDRQVATDQMFQPLHEIIELLKQYGVEFEEETHVKLAELPDKWAHTKKIAVQSKQLVGPIQAIHVNKLRKRITLFETRQNLLREWFKKLPIFNHECSGVYDLLDKTHIDIVDYENQLKSLEESAALFEVNLPEFKSIRQVRKELKQLKQLWDYNYIVQTSMNEWKKTPWKKLDVDNMEMECKKFAKEIRSFDKEMRPWDVYIFLEASVKNMLTSLRAVTELQNPAIRERHWQQLMATTKVTTVAIAHFIHHRRS